MERLVQWFLTERRISFPLPGQHAYTVGRSTETALSAAVDSIEKNDLEKETATGGKPRL